MIKPKLPLPEPLRGADPNSFAQFTVAERLPDIARRVLAENDFPQPIVRQLTALIEEIPRAPIRPLNDFEAPDVLEWSQYIEPYLGLNWLQIPWFLAETYFYRRLLEATGYFGSHHEDVVCRPGVDPFQSQKETELRSQEPWQVLSVALSRSNDNTEPSLRAILYYCVWGNRVDLSYNKVAEDSGREIVVEKEQANLLVDDTATVVRHIYQHVINQPAGKRRRIDFICDNAGTELLLDLALADYFLCFNWVQQVTLHVKAHPTFVSDAIPDDVEATIETIAARADPFLVSQLGARLQRYRADGRLLIQDHFFWNSPKFFWQMPNDLRAELAQAQLIVAKGDANYRRLLGDLHWPYTTPLADIISYLPAALVVLRTFKSEVAAGLNPRQIKNLETQDPNWLTNGQRGVIQFVDYLNPLNSSIDSGRLP